MERSRLRGALGYAALFVFALALRAVYLSELRGSLLFTELFGDGQQYDAWAREIAAGDWFGREVFYQAPLYPYFLGALYALFGPDLSAVRAVQAVLGALSCVLVAFAGTRWIGRWAGLAAGLFVAVHPPAIFFDGVIQKASLDLFIPAGLLRLLAAVQTRPRARTLASAGATLALFTLNRENARVLYAVVLPWIALGFPKLRAVRRAALALVFLAAAGAVVFPVAWRNRSIGGE